MPRAWSRKDERQFEHIAEQQMERGRSRDRAREIAARTVNKRRRLEGRSRNRTTQGTGNPKRRLEDRTVEELRNLAAAARIPGRTRMRKEELARAIRAARR